MTDREPFHFVVNCNILDVSEPKEEKQFVRLFSVQMFTKSIYEKFMVTKGKGCPCLESFQGLSPAEVRQLRDALTRALER